ncbi:MAG: ATP-binding protein [Aeromicrobium sp.]|uniref:uridine kinase family protein n=1 Tax=Aeromicrobium sp. TaxID=1871063 RepID=UPI003C5789E6
MGVVIVAGPSGSGKSHLGSVLGWPVLRLDDFYRDIDAPDMPRSTLGIIDWDDSRSWDASAAVATIAELCASGHAEVPVYDIATSRRTGSRALEVPDGRFIAEGLFAPVIVDACRVAGVLDRAICLRRPRLVTFALRLIRDLREGRKPPWVLVRRGWRLLQDEPRIVADAVARGCEPMSPRQAKHLLA